jgi:hypothetical protein
VKITVTVPPGLADRLARGSTEAQRHMDAGLREIGAAFVDAASGRARGRGRFARSFDYTASPGKVTAGSRSPLASIIEHGRKPGRRPPVSDRMSPAAAAKIGRSGTRGRFVVKKAAAAIRDDGTVDRVARQVVVSVARGV